MRLYTEKLKDPRWQKKRLEVLSRDQWSCIECGNTKLTLHVHHLKYAKGEPWDIDSEYLETLCEDCHRLSHQKSKRAQESKHREKPPNNSFLVVKHNHLIEGRYRLTLDEIRLLLLAISKQDSRSSHNGEMSIDVTAREYSDTYELLLKQAYGQIRVAASGLSQTKVTVKDTQPMHWLSTQTYNDGLGSVSLTFSQKIKPYLSQLNGMFTSYQISNISKLKSLYSIRMYELLKQWKITGKRVIPLEEFRRVLELEDSYPRFADLKRRVIQPAVDELNKQTDIAVSFNVEKQGRAVSTLLFSFSPKPLQVKV